VVGDHEQPSNPFEGKGRKREGRKGKGRKRECRKRECRKREGRKREGRKRERSATTSRTPFSGSDPRRGPVDTRSGESDRFHRTRRRSESAIVVSVGAGERPPRRRPKNE